MKNWKLSLVLAVILGGLTVVAYWDEWKTEQETAAEKQKNRLVSFNKEAVTQLIYQDRGEDLKNPDDDVTFTVQKSEAGSWQVTSPVAAKADSGIIDSLIKTVAEYKYERSIEDSAANRADYGLEVPRRSLQFKFSGGEDSQTKVNVGKKAPVGYSVYVSTTEKPGVFIGSQHLLTATKKTLTDVRDKSLVDLDVTKVTSLKYESKKDSLTFVKRDGKFKIVSPKPYDTDHSEVEDYLSFLANERVEDFKDSPSQDWLTLFKKPWLKLIWDEDGGKQTSLLFVEKGEDLWAAYDPAKVAFKLSSTAKTKLEKELFDFRDRSLAKFEAASVDRVEIDGESFRKVADDWYLAGIADQVAESEDKQKFETKNHVQDLIVDIEFAKTGVFLSPAKFQKRLADPADHKVILTFADDTKKQPLTLELWKTDDNKYLVRTNTEKATIFRVEESVFSNLKPKEKQTQALGLGEKTNG